MNKFQGSILLPVLVLG